MSMNFHTFASFMRGFILGKNGMKFINDTSSHTNGFYAIQVIEDAVIASMTATDSISYPTGVTIKAGMFVYGDITSIQLTSGSVVGYLK